ncbi:MAG: hypothetical protein QM820_62720 [Minicystis sp.]
MSGLGRASSVAAVALAGGALAGCAPEASAPAAAPKMVGAQTVAEWRRGLDRLSEIRKAAGAARTTRIALELREPRTGRSLQARGAVAIAPPRGLRMILLGPGGTTALDLWLDGGRFRFAVPAIDLKKRGDLASPREERRGLPVDFLGWWLLRPASGELLWYGRDRNGDRFVLRDGGAVVDLVAGDDGRITARRTTWSGSKRIDDETVEAGAIGCAPVRYHQGSTGLDVTVRCEGETAGEPPAKALADPDAEGGS